MWGLLDLWGYRSRVPGSGQAASLLLCWACPLGWGLAHAALGDLIAGLAVLMATQGVAALF